MKKILVSLLIVLILGGTYYAYETWLAPPNAKPWDFIPKNAAVVLETDKTLTTYNSIKSLSIWKALEDATFVKEIESNLAEIDSLISEIPIAEVFENTSSLIAFFPVSATSLDALFVLGADSRRQKKYLEGGVDFYKKNGYRFKTRIYNGFTIEELYKKSDGTIFSFIRHQDLLIGSFSPFLVEDAIRAFNASDENSFSSEFVKIRKLKPLQNDDGDLYFNMEEFTSLLNLFPKSRHDVFAKSAFLDVKFEQTALTLAGFTFSEGGLLSTFSTSPGSFDLLEVVPNNTSSLAHYSFKEAGEWRNNLLEFDGEIGQATAFLKSEFDVDINFLFDRIHQEIGVVDLEIVGTETPDRLILFDTDTIGVVKQFLKQAAARMSTDSVFMDRAGEYVIRQLNVEITTALLGKRSKLANDCYYTTHREYVLMSNSLKQLKNLVQSLESDNTWKKSLRVNDLLNLANGEANYSYIVNVPRSWNQLMNSLKPAWKSFFENNESGLKSLEYLSLQFSNVDDKFYTSVVAYQPEPPRQPPKVITENKVSLSANVITKPFLIRSHVNRALEILAQDSLLQLNHITSDFNTLWVGKLSEPIEGAIVPLDFYKNNKTQYAFCTTTQLHILDRTGAYIEGYPISISSKHSIAHFSVVDYDGSKDYRFMISDSQGDIYLLNKVGNLLKGWGPRRTGASLFSAPRHVRVAGKDAFVVMKKEGIVDLISRRGISYQGFPLDLKAEVVEAYFTETSGSFEASKMTTLTEGGEIVRINFSGRIEHREQLFKPNSNTTFSMVPDVLKNTFIIVRSSDNLWEVLDESGAKLFEKSYVSDSNRIIQFYRFGGGKALLLVTDVDLGLLTIYNLDGEVLTQKPLQSTNPVSILFSENNNSYTLYLGHDNLIEKVIVK